MASSQPDPQRWQKAYQWLAARAEKIAVDPEKLKNLLRKAVEKARSHSPALGNMVDDMHTLLRMLNARATGRYPNTPVKAIVAATVGILYFVLPLDFIPDFIPGLGLTDDIAVLAFLLRMISEDLEAFRRWERENGTQGGTDGLPQLE